MSKLNYFKLTLIQGAQTAPWPKAGVYFCELCLNSEGHKHLKKDWFVKIEPTEVKKCCSQDHSKEIRRAGK